VAQPFLPEGAWVVKIFETRKEALDTVHELKRKDANRVIYMDQVRDGFVIFDATNQRYIEEEIDPWLT
jgi:hypothetical protein